MMFHLETVENRKTLIKTEVLKMHWKINIEI